MNRQFLFIKSATESIALPVDSFSHAEYTTDTTVSAYFNATRSGKGASIKVILTVSSGKANDVVTSITNQVATGTAPVMKYDDVKDSFYTKNVTGVTSISTTEDPVSALTGQGVEPGGTTGQVLAKASNDDYDTEWVDYNTLYITVRNVSGGTLLKGTPVHDSGTTSSTPDVIAADASSAAAMPATYVLNEDIANNSEGQAIIVGIIENVDTSSFSAGDVIYVASGGGFTNVKPTGTNLIQNLGVVIKSSASTGSGVVLGAGRSNDLPNIPDGQTWIGNASGVPTATTLADVATTGTATSLTDISSAGSGSIITTAERNKLNNIEDNADVTDATNVTSSLVSATAISAGDKTAIQSNLDVDPSGTDNSTDVSLAGAYDYITIAGQTITRGQVDYTTDISNTPTIPSALSDLTGTSDDITEGTTNLFLTSAEEAKLGFISVTQAVDLDTMESDIATNNAKVSNVTTDLSTTTAASSVTVNSSDGTDATISAATTTVAGVMSGADKTKLDGISAGAEVNAVDSVNTQTGAVVLDADDIDDTSTTNKFTSTSDISKLSGIEAGADVTDSTNVTSSLVGATAITAGDKTTIQTNLGVDPSGTDNSTDVTLSGAYNYLTLADQQITLGQVDYTTDVSNTPTIPASGVDFDPVGTDNSTDVTLAGAYNYLTLLGQQITLGQVDYTTDISNTPTIPVSGVDFDPVGTDNSTDVSINANATDVLRMNPGQILGSQDAGADKLVFWDDSEGKLTYATIGTNLTMTDTTISASGGGGGANMSQSFTAPTSIGEFQDGARLVTDAYGTAPAATAGTLVSFGNTNVTAVGAQSAAAAATGMLTFVTDAASGDELLVEGVIKLSTATTTALLPTTAKKGSPVYMSTTAGAVTNTAPSTAGDFVRVVGHVVDATNRTIYFKPDNTWLEL